MRKLVVLLGPILASAISRQLVDEFKAWVPWLTRNLIMIAACLLPETERARRTEEWASHLEEVPGEIGKIVFALDLVRAGIWIRYESRDRMEIALQAWDKAKNQVLVYVFLANLVIKFRIHQGLVWMGLIREQPAAPGEANEAILALLLVGLFLVYQKSISSPGPVEPAGA
jgi:hypothetical protein